MSTASKPTLRYAVPSDGGAVGEYHVRCWQTAYRGLMADPVIDANQQQASSFGLSKACTTSSGRTPMRRSFTSPMAT